MARSEPQRTLAAKPQLTPFVLCDGLTTRQIHARQMEKFTPIGKLGVDWGTTFGSLVCTSLWIESSPSAPSSHSLPRDSLLPLKPP